MKKYKIHLKVSKAINQNRISHISFFNLRTRFIIKRFFNNYHSFYYASAVLTNHETFFTQIKFGGL